MDNVNPQLSVRIDATTNKCQFILIKLTVNVIERLLGFQFPRSKMQKGNMECSLFNETNHLRQLFSILAFDI